MNMVTLLAAADARRVIDVYKEAWDAAHSGTGKKMPKVVISRHIYVGETGRQAEQRGMFGIDGFYEKLVYLWRKYDVRHAAVADVLRSKTDTIIIGTAATVRARIEEQLEQCGANYFLPRFAYGDLTHEECVRSLKLFTEELVASCSL